MNLTKLINEIYLPQVNIEFTAAGQTVANHEEPGRCGPMGLGHPGVPVSEDEWNLLEPSVIGGRFHRLLRLGVRAGCEPPIVDDAEAGTIRGIR